MKTIITAALAIIYFMVVITLGVALNESYSNSRTYMLYQRLNELPEFITTDALMQGEPQKFAGLIRLHSGEVSNLSDGFYCSAAVISNKYAITAAHCLVDEHHKMRTDKIYIHSIINVDTEVIAKAAAINQSADVGLILGDFSQFDKLAMGSNVANLTAHPPFVTCGFPYGDSSLCVMFTPSSNYYSSTYGDGILFPGMSGGPVVSITDRIIVAVNSGTLSHGIIVSPLVGFFASVGVAVK